MSQIRRNKRKSAALAISILSGGGGPAAPPSFDSLVTAASPKIWFDFQDAVLNGSLACRGSIGVSIEKSGNGGTVSTPWRSTTTQSCQYGNNNSDYHISANDGRYAEGGFKTTISNQANFSQTWGMQVAPSASVQHVPLIQWTAAYGVGPAEAYLDSAIANRLLCLCDSENVERMYAVKNGMDKSVPHVYTMRWASGVHTLFEDGVKIATSGTAVNPITRRNYTQLQLGGYCVSPANPGNIPWQIDHYSLTQSNLTDEEIIAMQEAYVAELV